MFEPCPFKFVLINRLYDLLTSGRSSTETGIQNISPVSSESTTETAATPTVQYDDPEYTVLSMHLGPLETGRTITVSLTELLTILPRQRRRADAYAGLVKKLGKDGITLIITSRRTKNEQD